MTAPAQRVQVALALLPEGLNVGDRLKREFFDYEKI